MEFWEISLYSLVQGITEFLPISSSAHLFIFEKILNWPIPGRTMAIAAHLGSLFAVILYLKYDLINIVKSLFKATIFSASFRLNPLSITIVRPSFLGLFGLSGKFFSISFII